MIQFKGTMSISISPRLLFIMTMITMIVLFMMTMISIGKSSVHKLIRKRHRQFAFLVQSSGHIFGVILGPALGLLLFDITRQLKYSCFFFSGFVYWTCLLFQLAIKDEENRMRRGKLVEWLDVEQVRIKKIPTVVRAGMG